MMSPLVRRTLVLVALLLAPAAKAAEPQTQPNLGDLSKGHWNLSLYAGYDYEFSTEPKIGYGAVGVSYFVFDELSLGGEARYYRSNQDGPDANIYDLNIILRQYIFRFDRWTIFFDASAGVSEADHRVPPGGTNFNFIEEAGFGATYQVGDHVYLIGGIRYFHLSNAKLHGADENPSLNGIGGYVGLMWTF